MFHLMIVEDEVRLQYNLAYNIAWEEYGVEVVGTATSGEEALPLIRLRKPDILLVDIELQGMDGLQLMQAVRTQDSGIRFIVLSGHDDFEYAQGALRQGADNYLLKPAGNSEVIAAVMDSIERIKAEREMKYGIELLEQRWKEHLPTLQKGFLQQWVKGKVKDMEFDKAAEELMLVPLCSPNGAFLVAIVDLDPLLQTDTTGEERDRKWLQSSLHSIVAEYVNGADCHLSIDDNGSTVMLFISGKEEEEQWLYRVNISIVKLQEVIRDLLGVTVSAGIGRPAGREDVPVSYRQAQRALQERYMYGYSLVIPFTPGNATHSTQREEPRLPDAELERKLQLALETNDAPKAQQLITQWYRDYCEPLSSATLLLEQFIFMHSLLTRAIQQQGWPVLDVAGEELSPFRRPDEPVSKEMLVPWAGRVIESILEYADRQRLSKRHHFIDGLMEIVEQSLDQDIGLHEIADRLFVHPSYLSRLFKKETKMTFSAYLYERKMQRAKELLQEGARVYEASQRIGYRDISYFTKLFRKYWGVMPSEVSRER